MTAGAIASKTNDGNVHATSGNESRTGSRRASASFRRLRAARASWASDSSTGASGKPSRSALARTSVSPTAPAPRCSGSATRARVNSSPRSRWWTAAANPWRAAGGATPAISRIAWTGVRPAWISSTRSSIVSGSDRSISSRARRFAAIDRARRTATAHPAAADGENRPDHQHGGDRPDNDRTGHDPSPAWGRTVARRPAGVPPTLASCRRDVMAAWSVVHDCGRVSALPIANTSTITSDPTTVSLRDLDKASHPPPAAGVQQQVRSRRIPTRHR